MELPDYILEEARQAARRAIAGEIVLPAKLSEAPLYWVADGSDGTILAFSAFTLNDRQFKIGVSRAQGERLPPIGTVQ